MSVCPRWALSSLQSLEQGMFLPLCVFTRLGSQLLPAPVLGTRQDQSFQHSCLCCQLEFCTQSGCFV